MRCCQTDAKERREGRKGEKKGGGKRKKRPVHKAKKIEFEDPNFKARLPSRIYHFPVNRKIGKEKEEEEKKICGNGAFLPRS